MTDSTAQHLFFGNFIVIGYGICFVVGLAMLIPSYIVIRRRLQFLQTATAAASGVVVENIWTTGATRQDGCYCPRIRFQTTDGHEIDFVSDSGNNPASYSVGESVSLLYDPQHPEKASINSFTSLWLLPILLGILGVGCTVPGIIFLVGKIASNQ
jgi:hypothetical protein